jgi:hypothetical protein
MTPSSDAGRSRGTTPPCPRCGSSESVPIVYGYPSADLFEASERDEIRLGGCVVGAESPELECVGCGEELPWLRRG